MRRTIHPRTRGGFTLVELLVVATIIAVLVALISSAVVKALNQGPLTRARNDIGQLAAGIQAFKTHYQVQYVPSRIVLKPRVAFAPAGDYNQTDPVDVESMQFLKSVWPRLGSGPNNTIIPINWGATGTLDGAQCLVFFLGGAIVPGGGCVGFSNNPVNPMDTSSLSNRVGPFYSFPADRLTVLSGASYAVFVDAFEKQPYVYFSAGRGGNDYPVVQTGNLRGSVVGATTSGGVTVYPYQTAGADPTQTVGAQAPIPARIWANKDSFQIVSAGPDGVFGIGGIKWFGYTAQAPTAEGRDDLVNFRQYALGVE